MTTFDYQAAAASPPTSGVANRTTSPSGSRSAVRDAAHGGRVLSFFRAVVEFIVGDSGIDFGDACLRCSSSEPDVRAFIINAQSIDGLRWRAEHTKERQQKGLPNPVGSIVIHRDGETCPRVRVAECDVCLMTVDLDPISDGCPAGGTNHHVANKRPKPRLYLAPASSAQHMTDS